MAQCPVLRSVQRVLQNTTRTGQTSTAACSVDIRALSFLPQMICIWLKRFEMIDLLTHGIHLEVRVKVFKGALYGIEPSTRNGKIWPTRERQHRQYLKISC